MTLRAQHYEIAPAEAATVLLVDDEPDLLEEMAEVLENAGYRCVTANDANHAFKIIQQEADVGLVVTDIRMPGLDGVEFIREMKNKSRREQNLAMVALSGHAGFDEAVRAMRAGAEDFLTKPVSPDDLLRAIDRALALTTLRRTESQFREGLATQSEEKARTIEQIQETLRHKNRYIGSLENSCEMALNRGRYFSAIGHEIAASVAQQIRSIPAGGGGLDTLAENLGKGLDTVQVCAALGAKMSAVDFIMGRVGLVAQATALKAAVFDRLSRRGLILEIESAPDERPTGVGSPEFFACICAVLLCAAGRAEPESRIGLNLDWQGQRLSAAIHFSGPAFCDGERALIKEHRLVRTYSTQVDPSLYVAHRMLGEGVMSLDLHEEDGKPHCITMTAHRAVS